MNVSEQANPLVAPAQGVTYGKVAIGVDSRWLYHVQYLVDLYLQSQRHSLDFADGRLPARPGSSRLRAI